MSGRFVTALFCLLTFCSSLANGEVNLELRATSPTLTVGETADIALYAVSSGSADQPFSAMDVLLEWDHTHLQLVAHRDNGPYAWLMSTFPPDSALDGLNDSLLDGDAKYTALSRLTTAAEATPAGLLVTTFEFQAICVTPITTIDMPRALGIWSHTRVFGTDAPGQEVTGTLTGTSIQIVPEPVGLLTLATAFLLIFRRRARLNRTARHPDCWEHVVSGVQANSP